jgi:hypothetical protein
LQKEVKRISDTKGLWQANLTKGQILEQVMLLGLDLSRQPSPVDPYRWQDEGISPQRLFKSPLRRKGPANVATQVPPIPGTTILEINTS